MSLDERDVAWIVERVRSRCDVTAIWLFGSHARHRSHGASDIDLLIVGPSRLPRPRRGREVAAALAVFPRPFDLLFYTEQELAEECADPYSFMSSVMAGAQALYRRSASHTRRAPHGTADRSGIRWRTRPAREPRRAPEDLAV